MAEPMASRSRKSAKPQRSRYFIEAIGRGLDVLSLFDVEHPSLTLSEIARRSNCVPSTALRFIQTLVDLDYLEELTESGRYRPSLAALKLGHTALSTSPLRAVARPVLEALQRETKESIILAVRVKRNVVLVDALVQPDQLSVDFHPGSRFPSAATAVGKAVLSRLWPEELESLFANYTFHKLGPNSVLSMKELESALRTARRDGFAIEDDELAAGLRGVAAPIVGESGAVEAAVGIVAGSTRMTLDRIRRELASLTVRAASELSSKMPLRLQVA
jgi:IclR family pca regulon transcriptional regulator